MVNRCVVGIKQTLRSLSRFVAITRWPKSHTRDKVARRADEGADGINDKVDRYAWGEDGRGGKRKEEAGATAATW